MQREFYIWNKFISVFFFVESKINEYSVQNSVCDIYIYIYRISYTIYIGWYRKSTLCIHETHIQTHSNTVHNVTHKNIGNIIQIQVHYVWKIKKINFNWLQSTFSSSKFNMLFACFYDIRIFSKQNREKNCIHQRIFLFFWYQF